MPTVGTTDIYIDIHFLLAPCAFVGCQTDYASFCIARSMLRVATRIVGVSGT